MPIDNFLLIALVQFVLMINIGAAECLHDQNIVGDVAGRDVAKWVIGGEGHIARHLVLLQAFGDITGEAPHEFADSLAVGVLPAIFALAHEQAVVRPQIEEGAFLAAAPSLDSSGRGRLAAEQGQGVLINFILHGAAEAQM